MQPIKNIDKNKRIWFIVYKKLFKADLEYIWLWVAIEPKDKQILPLSISKERNMFIAERFLLNIVRNNEKHLISTD
jgi:putative transposase